jgi:hypothetical protein
LIDSNNGMSAHAEITKLLVDYEQQHAVDEYRVYAWRVWPHLRSITALKYVDGLAKDLAEAKPSAPADSRLGTRISACWRDISRMLRPFLRDVRRHAHHRPGRQDVVVLTHSNRRVQLGKMLWHPIADPLVEFLGRHGLSTLVWEHGPERYPRRNPSAWIDSLLLADWRLFSRAAWRQALPSPPAWFGEFESWCREAVGLELTWDTWVYSLQYVEVLSRVFQRWLEGTACRYLLVDCWYGQESMAATLAARRLGIPAVDIQHGQQASTHFCYASWTRKPREGYETVPEAFWVWGDDDAIALPEESRPGNRVLVGGNLWLNMWKEAREPLLRQSVEKACLLSDGWTKTVLVTTQPVADMTPVLDAIRRSPRNWRWLLRLHQRTPDIVQTGRTLAEKAGHPGVDVVNATRQPLFALMQASDVHVTGFSTCGLEALAFGKPTVLFHPTGREAYAKCLDEGVMSYAPDGPAIVEQIRAAERVSPDNCHRVAEGVFASNEASERAFSKLFADRDRMTGPRPECPQGGRPANGPR